MDVRARSALPPPGRETRACSGPNFGVVGHPRLSAAYLAVAFVLRARPNGSARLSVFYMLGKSGNESGSAKVGPYFMFSAGHGTGQTMFHSLLYS